MVPILSLEDLREEAKRLVARLTPRQDRATLITLSGELGAGKTAFTKEIARVLGVSDGVTSPTFVLEKIYALPQGQFKRLVHIDAYRLKRGEELSSLGFDESMKDPWNLVVLEWPEQVSGALPTPDIRVRLAVQSSGERTLSYEEG